MDEQRTEDSTNTVDDPRWLLIALACIGVHQVQSAIVEPKELRFRLTTLTIAALTPTTLRLPPRVRGAIWLLIAIPPFFGALAGHLVPIVRDGTAPPASETAPLNLAGAALLLALGASLLRSPAAVAATLTAE